MHMSQKGEAFQAFLVGAKSFLMDTVYPKARDAVADARAATADKEEAVEALRPDADYGYFCWLEHYIQHYKYNARFGLAAEAESQRDALVSRLTAIDKRHDVAVPVDVPEYYSVVDIHQHPGNLHADILAGYIYKASAASTQPGSTNSYGLHYKFTDVVEQYAKDPKSILDLACGFGKSALPLAQRWPDARVEGIDLSEGCLRLAAVEAEENGLDNLSYSRADVASTGKPDASYDLVTSTMLLHELDTDAVKASMKEAHRVLADGGTLVQLDFRARNPVEEFFLHGHGQRNNEPYMAAFDELDFKAYLESIGFTDIEIKPFEESPGATSEDFPKWRLPWTVISARKAAAA
ncbi:MAG: class I SAM-dependent methyltransferase [Mesorhizobium sp.]